MQRPHQAVALSYSELSAMQLYTHASERQAIETSLRKTEKARNPTALTGKACMVSYYYLAIFRNSALFG